MKIYEIYINLFDDSPVISPFGYNPKGEELKYWENLLKGKGWVFLYKHLDKSEKNRRCFQQISCVFGEEGALKLLPALMCLSDEGKYDVYAFHEEVYSLIQNHYKTFSEKYKFNQRIKIIEFISKRYFSDMDFYMDFTDDQVSEIISTLSTG